MTSAPPPLPPGQRESEDFPRFGLPPFAFRYPRQIERIEVHIGGDVECPTTIEGELRSLSRVEVTDDLHCVTTWSRRSLTWSGYRFSDVFESLIVPRARPAASATILMLRGQDGYESSLPLKDALADTVLLADRLNGEPLSVEHGAPLRFVAPSHYGYKSVKHLWRLRLCTDERFDHGSVFRFLQHRRGRVQQEERARGIPGKLLRFLYRPLIRPTITRFRRGMQAYPGGATE